MAALHLARQNYAITFIAWGNLASPSWLANYPSLKYRLSPKKSLLSALSFLAKVIWFFWQEKPDFVYVQGAQQTPFLFWLPWFKGKTSLIYHTQDYLEYGRHRFYEVCERFFAKRANWVISNEPNRARFMASNYRLKAMPQVIRTALPSWWSIPERDITYRQQLLTVAGLRDVKQPRLIVAGGPYSDERMSGHLLDAMLHIPNNYALIFTDMEPDTSQYRSCNHHLSKKSLGKRVLMLGKFTYEQLLNLYAVCDIGILLYPNNGIGHFYQAPGRLTEYLKTGLSLVASNFPGLELLVIKHNLGYVANPYDSMSIAKAIENIGIQSDAQMDEIRQNLINIANAEFSYEFQANLVFGKIFNCL